MPNTLPFDQKDDPRVILFALPTSVILLMKVVRSVGTMNNEVLKRKDATIRNRKEAVMKDTAGYSLAAEASGLWDGISR